MKNSVLELGNLIKGFRLSCQTEGKSPKTIEWYICFLERFLQFLNSHGYPLNIGQIEMIKIAEIDFQNKNIKVVGKGRKERLVPITFFTSKYIVRYLDRARSKICPKDCPYLFANSDGEPISKNSVQQFMRRLLAKSGLRVVKFSPHIFRHSFATQYLTNGGNLFYLKAILEHKSTTTTLKYTQVQVKSLQNQHAKFSPVAELFRNKS